MAINMDLIKQLRDETGAGIVEAKNALDNAEGNFEAAKAVLMKKVESKAAKKSDRVTKDGLVYAYIHSTGKIGSLIALASETDFVAKTEDFKKLCHNVAMQVCTDDYETVEQVLESEFIKDPSKKIQDLVNELTAKVGEKIELKKFIKFSVTE